MEQRVKSKVRQRKLLYRGIGIAATLLIVLVVLLLCVIILGKDDLEGTWGAADVIVEFDGKDKGAWFCKDQIERFDYEIKGDTLFVDFRRENVRDREYTVSFADGTLLLTDPEGSELHLNPIP